MLRILLAASLLFTVHYMSLALAENDSVASRRPAAQENASGNKAVPGATFNSQNFNPEKDPANCCKVCTAEKACGDSCIARSMPCHRDPGCACNGI